MNNEIVVYCMWDMDGVLVDSEELHRTKHEYVLSKVGIGHLDNRYAHENATTFDMPENGTVVSKTIALHGTNDTTNYYWAIHNAPELKDKLTLDQWLDEEMLFYLQAAKNGILKEREGVSEIMRMLDQQQDDGIIVVQGIVTNGSPRQVAANRSVLGQQHLLKFEVNSDTIMNGQKGKSYISGQILAGMNLKDLGITSDHACPISLAVEDSPSGVRKAIGDGIPPANVVQWIIPSLPAYRPSEERWKGFRHAHTPSELLQQIYAIEEQAAGISLPHRPERHARDNTFGVIANVQS